MLQADYPSFGGFHTTPPCPGIYLGTQSLVYTCGRLDPFRVAFDGQVTTSWMRPWLWQGA